MSNYKLVFSPTGGTQKVTELLAQVLMPEHRTVDLCAPISDLVLGAQDLCLVAVPSFGGRVPAVAVDRLRQISANGAAAILVCVYGNRQWDDTLTELQDTLEAAGFGCVAAVAAVAEHSIFRQFAAGRPDSADAEELRAFALDIRKKLESGADTTPVLPGKHGSYQVYLGVPFKPSANKHCVRCGLCAQNCPVAAIDPAAPDQTDKSICISCMRCVSLCPSHARQIDPLLKKGAALALTPALGGRKKNHLYL